MPHLLNLPSIWDSADDRFYFFPNYGVRPCLGGRLFFKTPLDDLGKQAWCLRSFFQLFFVLEKVTCCFWGGEEGQNLPFYESADSSKSIKAWTRIKIGSR